MIIESKYLAEKYADVFTTKKIFCDEIIAKNITLVWIVAYKMDGVSQ